MSALDTLTLDQIRLFVAVAEEGSFSGAARKYKRAQSAVSYGIANLEQALELSLFDRSGRRPILTPIGQSLMAEAQSILNSFHALRSKALGINQGLETEVSLVASAIAPPKLLIELASRFHLQFPDVSLRLQTDVMDEVAQCVIEGSSDIGIIGPVELNSKDLKRHFVCDQVMIPVVSSAHSLASKRKKLSREDFENELQVVIAHRGSRPSTKSANVYSSRTWRVADAHTKLQFIEAGLGWGYLPKELVESGLKSRRLKQLRLEAQGSKSLTISLYQIYKRDLQPGPATRWLQEFLRNYQT